MTYNIVAIQYIALHQINKSLNPIKHISRRNSGGRV